MVKFKRGVEWDKEGILKIIMVGEMVYSTFGKDLVVTSLMEGNHKPNSKHYVGQAADFRTHFFKLEELPYVVEDLRELLGEDYDVILETTHIHVEYDPEISKVVIV